MSANVDTAEASGDVQSLLHNVGRRATRQRIAPAGLLLTNANRRLIAEILNDEADDAWRPVSRATVGNTLRQFDGPVC
jgi:Fur family iron response transcriptional regulator